MTIKTEKQDYARLIQKICNKTISEKSSNPDIKDDLFETIEGQGMYIRDTDSEVSNEYKGHDMIYDLFEWQNGVGFYALIEAGKVLNDDSYISFVKDWVDFHLQKGLPSPSINSTAPFLSILEVFKKTGDKKYETLCEERARFCLSQALRADQGAFEHTVMNKSHKFTSQIWADTLFMGALFLAKWGVYSKNDMYLHEAIRQFQLHYHYLTDKDTGLLFHGYSCDLRTHLSSVRWGRANGWGLIACVILLPLIPDSFKEKQTILNLYLHHVEKMVKYQNLDGSFHTVLDDKSTYKETSVASAFTFSLLKAVKLGYLDKSYLPYAHLSLDYIIQNITPDGIVEKASGGTPIMCSIEEYNKIPYSTSYYGQGMAVMALNEA